MKRCPECYELYEDSEKFCELDGQPLFADPALGGPSSPRAMAVSRSRDSELPFGEFTRPGEAWFIGTAGVLLGVVVCVGGYLAYGIWTEDDAGINNSPTANFTSQTQEPIRPPRPTAAPRVETAPEEEEPVAAETETSPEPSTSPTEDGNAVAARLNQGPVSTGQRKKEAADEKSEGQTIIQMNDGTALEVDAAWEDGQGVWYRRGGMVAFVESQRVKAITGRAAQKPSSVASQ